MLLTTLHRDISSYHSINIPDTNPLGSLGSSHSPLGMILSIADIFFRTKLQGNNVDGFISPTAGRVHVTATVLPSLDENITLEVWGEPRGINVCKETKEEKVFTM